MGARRAPVLQAREELGDPARRRHVPPRAARAAHRDLILHLAYAFGALLLLIGGALKLVDPSGSVGALRALGVPASSWLVRAVAGAELVLGALALTITSAVVAALIAVSYAAFLAVTAVALGRGLPIDSCGCLGRLETPPSWRHLVVLGVAFAGAVGTAIDPGASLLERLADDGAEGVVFAVVVLAATGAGVVVMRMGRR